jgi:hypothetical protein
VYFPDMRSDLTSPPGMRQALPIAAGVIAAAVVSVEPVACKKS